MKVKTGDKVKILTGKDRGKIGSVLQVFKDKKTNKVSVVVEGLNIMKKHLKGRQGQSGQVIELSAPISASNVMVIDPKSNKPTRVGYLVEADTKKRVAKRGNALID